MSYQVIARKWRPQTFEEVTGQEIITHTLRNAIAQAKGGAKPIELLVRRGDRFLTVPLAYYGGLRWPWLERYGVVLSRGGVFAVMRR